MPGSPQNTASDFYNLTLISHDEQLSAIESVLGEISAVNYRGPYPPNNKSREQKCKGAVMLQFVWHSDCFGGKEMCFKFCVVDQRLVVLRIHPAYNPNQFERMEKEGSR